MTGALKQRLDTPDAGQRLEIVQAYCRWSSPSPDVPTLLRILRFPGQYRDCWPPAFLLLGSVSPSAARQIVEDRWDEPSLIPTVFENWETGERSPRPCSRRWQRASRPPFAKRLKCSSNAWA